ncbi:Fe-S cluster assembly protein NifU [Desulfobotulus sp. H1]|uniref:Nitrogen fixation protein NifU n=1 Tax=Desulfobotulus pelophilus TaxID=2823377 RepID=A0ABT3N6X5_9BACT|nr:Fe-S cluster assembly protein NifU [Desulfobotulus pelophilus]MCW7753208.1 Fe-S cluster assembly protein NifU [Desulfobotulus pelophilus]
MWDYTDKVREHFLNPKNVGEVENPDGIGEVGSIACGDALKLTFRLGKDKKIAEARFKTFGCASAIASSSVLTEMIIGKTLEEVEKISNDDIAMALGGLPKEKIHCSVMGQEALEKAIAYYKGEPEKILEGEIICHCFNVTDVDIRRAVQEKGLTSLEDVTGYLKAGGGCGNCHEEILQIIQKSQGMTILEPKKPAAGMTNLQKIRKIEETLESEIKPALIRDGGNIELVDVDGNRVLVRLQGACATCSRSRITLKDHVEARLRTLVAHDLVVEEA